MGGGGFINIWDGNYRWLINPLLRNLVIQLWLGGGGFINIWDGNYRWLVNPPLRNLVIQEYIENSKIGRGGFAEIHLIKSRN
ncbi:MAG: hypothetical protein EAZ86_25225 [Oscillatoriales cyanobacterium]|nr:MAG: hypothetical protein EAZ86_25225 [Oscillatoriales cyanobacterium]